MNRIAQILHRFGISPNLLTIMGLAISTIAMVLIIKGFWWLAALFILISGICDMLDGKIARLHFNRGRFGALLDSSLDRYSDACFYTGFLFYFLSQNLLWEVVFSISALVAAFQISYVRARAEGLGYSCHVGFWERPERIVAILLGILSANLTTMILILGTLPHLTALRRLWHVSCQSKPDIASKNLSNSAKSKKNRRSRLYAIQMAILALILVFFRF